MLLVTICWRKSMKINQFKPDPRLQTICVLFHSCSTTIQVTTCINLQTSLLLYPQSSSIFILHPPPRDHLWKARSPWALILLLHWHLHCGAMRVLKKTNIGHKWRNISFNHPKPRNKHKPGGSKSLHGAIQYKW